MSEALTNTVYDEKNQKNQKMFLSMPEITLKCEIAFWNVFLDSKKIECETVKFMSGT